MKSLPSAGAVTLLLAGVLATPAQAVEQRDIDLAIRRGVQGLKRMQRASGKWPLEQIGATALAGLALLEAGEKPTDPSVQRAAHAVRDRIPEMTKTYGIALSILFLDRLGEPADIPLIESLTVRLLAGQNSMGGWSYTCPTLPAAERQRLRDLIKGRKLVGAEAAPRVEKKRTFEDLSPETQRQLRMLALAPGADDAVGGDNSNTQFAIIALWVARRYGLPIQQALARVNLRFRASQAPNGTWAYTISETPSPEGGSATMTCAGLLGLAVAHGVALDGASDKKHLNIDRDVSLKAGLIAVSSAVGVPTNGLAPIPRIQGKAYYYLWSLERVAMILDLKTLAKKDWYNWGAELLIANQLPDGTWRGEYASSGADTCFALLFLSRSNLATDLTARLRGKVGDPGSVLRAGGVGGEALRAGKAAKLPLPFDGDSKGSPGRGPTPPTSPRTAIPEDINLLARQVLRASGTSQQDLLDQLSSTRGSEKTLALLDVIYHAEADLQSRARDALAQRMTRMTTSTLDRYLEHEDTELRRAAALAVGMKKADNLIPKLIQALSDSDPHVVQAARASLKTLSGGRDWGPDPDADRSERARAIASWQIWWKENRNQP
jgi:hypothetical protein